MRRFSIFAMMGFVLACGVALAALRNASELWAGILFVIDLGALGAALLGVIYLRGKERAWWLGFGLFGGGYLMLTLAPWLGEQFQPKLGTTQVLEYVHSRVTLSPVPVPSKLQDLHSKRAAAISRLANAKRIVRSASDPSVRVAEQRLADLDDQISSVQGFGVLASTAAPAATATASAPFNLWRSLLPGAAHYEQFLRVGHGLFAVLAGLVGATIASHFHSRRMSRPAPVGDDVAYVSANAGD
jgi:hypothetical protein